MEKRNFDSYLFHEGTNYKSYDYLGAHQYTKDGNYICSFRTWAPNAVSVSLASDFTTWDTPLPMNRVTDDGVWETTIENDTSFEGMFYKFSITGRDGKTYLKSDPYAFCSETLGSSASIVYDINKFSWSDEEWLKSRAARLESDKKKRHFFSAPMNIYELHLASWKTRNGETTADGKNYMSYREAADEISAYVKNMGYTHIELMPIMEYPFDGSWGYQISSYYAPTSRFGKPEDFAYFVNKMHETGIGVILDWVPAHFPKDRPGLFEFDGEPLYEYQGADKMEHRGWGTRCFDVGRCEVQSFLISNALFWMKEYHIDGLRVDAVASMLYLDYDREPGEWTPNVNGDNKNLEAIAFFQKLNSAVFAEIPDVLMIAEESTAWPMVTKPASDGGLGFNFKWNMGWANDMFEYVASDPIYRQYEHNKLTFPMMYAYSENFVLPVSHDEVVHGKKSLIDKMFGSYDDKFSGMRAFLVNMMTMPGKKLMFMGCEYAQFREWDFANQLEWFMTEYPRHTEMQRFVRALNNLYVSSPELWEIDDSWDGFEWIYPNSSDINVVAYKRRDIKGNELVTVVNYSPVKREKFVLDKLKRGKYTPVINSDLYEFGGGGIGSTEEIKSITEDDDRETLTFTLPPLCGIIFRRTGSLPAKAKKKQTDAKSPSKKDTEKNKKTSSEEESKKDKTKNTKKAETNSSAKKTASKTAKSKKKSEKNTNKA